MIVSPKEPEFIPFSVFVESIANVGALNPGSARVLLENHLGRVLDVEEAAKFDEVLLLVRWADGWVAERDALFTLTRLLRRFESRDEQAAS